MKKEKKEALAGFHRSRMIEAAENLFETQGIAGTTMDQIARSAGYSKATLYVYFTSKEEMANCIRLKGLRILLQTIRESAGQAEEWEKTFFAICSAVTGFYKSNPAAYEAAAGEIHLDLDNPDAPPILREIYETGEEINREIAALLKKGAACGAISPQHGVKTVLFLWAGLTGIVRMSGDKEEYLQSCLGFNRQEFEQHCCQMLLNSLRGGTLK